METRVFWALAKVSDQELRGQLTSLLASSYRTESRIIAHIAEVEERKLHLREGSHSLFEYCVKRLGLSESEAFHRITAARVARQFPIVFTMIEGRQIHLTAVCLLRDYLTSENHLELLTEASHKTKLQVQELLARRFPRPDVSSYVRKLPNAQVAKQSSTVLATSVDSTGLDSTNGPPVPLSLDAPQAQVDASISPQPTQPPGPHKPTRAVIEPTSAARYRIQLNASAALKEKLELFQALVSHSVPNGDVAAALERALDLAIEQVQKHRFAKTDKPRRSLVVRRPHVEREHAGREHVGREHIPNVVQREIVERDELRCTFVSGDGCRCSARAFLQIHHEAPWARGGEPSVENLRLLCASHNRLLAERDFGVAHVAERIAESRRNESSCRRFLTEL